VDVKEPALCSPETYDVVGIGFGPSNLSLAIALREAPVPVTARFFERQPSLGWHQGMLMPSAKMQVSFLKDLATFRNPASTYSFVSFLHETGRLAYFVNNSDFYPTRREFHAYLEWAASKLQAGVSYATEVVGVEPVPRPGTGQVDRLRVLLRAAGASEATRYVEARNVVISTGLVPRMPVGVERDEHVWHSSAFLHELRARGTQGLRRVAVVGAGQSAAEIVRYVYDTMPGATVHAILPSYGYAIADNTPFANEVFDPAAVDDFYRGTPRAKDAIWHYHKNTNYSVVDGDVIRDLYRRAGDEVGDDARLRFARLSRVVDVKRVAHDTRVTVHSLISDETYDLDVDVLICATGYDPMDPAEMLAGLDDRLMHDDDGRYRIARDYRLLGRDDLRCGVYLQGGSELSHGLSSSLLSNIAVRSGEIAHSIVTGRNAAQEKGVSA
jgi:L-ornithine N5-monooxygenase